MSGTHGSNQSGYEPDTSIPKAQKEKPTPVTSVLGFLQHIYEKEYMNPDREEITAYRGHFKSSYELKPGIGRIEDPHGEKERELFMQFKRSYQSFSTVQSKRDIDLLFFSATLRLKDKNTRLDAKSIGCTLLRLLRRASLEIRRERRR